MWICPTCKREFQRQHQDHYCGVAIASIDAYIEAQPEDIQPILHKVRHVISEVIPEATEKISWSMPTFWKDHNIIHFAAFKKHMGLYPGPKAIEVFSDRLLEYKTSKGAIQFQYLNPIPYELIAEIARWCYDTGHHH